MSFQEKRITKHPILVEPEVKKVEFTFNGKPASGFEGEAVSSALFAGGIHVFGHHHTDESAQGMFCANGQCSQCSLIIDGIPRKSCIVPLKAGMEVESLEGLPELRDLPGPDVRSPRKIDTGVLILGGGPSGMAAAIELGKKGIDTIIVDDKDRLGGKLVLQTHKFFGSVADCHAGTRGIHIAELLAGEISELKSVDVWLDSIVLGVFSDGTVGIRCRDGYRIVKSEYILVATGAREKSLPFPGCTLPGVYGAGAFQTLVNRDLVRCAERIFIVGGGNVGLIAAYHALQAGMTVVGLAEALPVCGGYKVHADKIKRLGVPIYTGHTVLAAHGREQVEAVTIAEVDDSFKPIPGTEKSWEVDTVLIAVGLNPVDEFNTKASQFDIETMMAGDAEEIAEASAAMFSGKIRGLQIARKLGVEGISIPSDLHEKAEVLKSPGGKTFPYLPSESREGVYPVLHCMQEIPCNPCMTICPKDLIGTSGHPIMGLPEFHGSCVGCEKCVAVCPGLAVTLVDFRKSAEKPLVTIPFELGEWLLEKGGEVTVTGWEGSVLGKAVIKDWKTTAGFPNTILLKLETPADIASRTAGVMIQYPENITPLKEPLEVPLLDDAIVCRCERVTAGEIRKHIRSGIRDMNHLKAITRAGFGACGGKTCSILIERICREEGIPDEEVTAFTDRPLFAETQLGWFSGTEDNDE
ncbi:MAG: FAD-dependent oxidoreductase [Candidatus Aegiribacteria sp.]|nr:FAD-dependent oxidoreductase [Candidatus Aegiribacteria sp.]